MDVEQEFDFTEPLVVTEGTTSFNVTVLMDLDAWFRDGTGNLVDPATGNTGEVNEGLIKENIKQSTEAFEDDDHDGDEAVHRESFRSVGSAALCADAS